MSDEHDFNAALVTSDSNSPGFASAEVEQDEAQHTDKSTQLTISQRSYSQDKYIAYTIKLPAYQLAALQSIWLELKRLYGAHSPDKSGMIQQAIEEWLKRWDGPEKHDLLDNLLQIRADTRRRQYKKSD
jgi:hypothetical protein